MRSPPLDELPVNDDEQDGGWIVLERFIDGTPKRMRAVFDFSDTLRLNIKHKDGH